MSAPRPARAELSWPVRFDGPRPIPDGAVLRIVHVLHLVSKLGDSTMRTRLVSGSGFRLLPSTSKIESQRRSADFAQARGAVMVGGGLSGVALASVDLSVPADRLTACSSAWTTLVLRARAAVFREGRAV